MKRFFLQRGKLLIYTFYFLLFFLLLWIWTPATAADAGVPGDGPGIALPSSWDAGELFNLWGSRRVCIDGGPHIASGRAVKREESLVLPERYCDLAVESEQRRVPVLLRRIVS